MFYFSFFSITGWGVDLDYCDIEWFALETNTDQSVILEIASKHSILDSFRLPMSEVRGRSWEDPMPEGRQPIGVTQSLRSGAVADSARLQRCRNGREELPRVQGQKRQPRGATPHPKSEEEAKRSNPTSKERRLCRHRRAERRCSTFKVRRGGHEEIPLVQGKGQWLHFAGAAVKRHPQVQGKRNPSKTVGVVRGHQRAKHTETITTEN